MRTTASGLAIKVRGFTITELLIAMTLGLILISGMISVFVSTKRTSDLNSAVANSQESARFAMDSLTSDIRMAGFQGCLDINNISIQVQASDAPTTNLRESLISGSVVQAADQWVPAPPANYIIPSGAITAVPGTHTINIQAGSAANSVVSGLMQTAGVISLNADIPVSNNFANLKAGEYAIISDCTSGDLFKVSDAPADGEAGVVGHKASHNTSGNLSKAYGENSQIGSTRLMKFVSNMYFIGTRGDVTLDGDPIRSLYVQTLPYIASNPPVELIEGVENMRIRFGIRQSNGSLLYVTADQPEYDPTEIYSVQVGLMMVSYERIRTDDDGQTYVLAGQEIPAHSTGTALADANSHRGNEQHRLVFNSTTQLRNRRY